MDIKIISQDQYIPYMQTISSALWWGKKDENIPIYNSKKKKKEISLTVKVLHIIPDLEK